MRRTSGPGIRVATLFVLLVGLFLQLWLCGRGQVGGDQAILLDLGQQFAADGELAPVAKSMSGGAWIPGSLLQLLVGAPLRVWNDPRAAVLVIGILQLLAAMVLTHTFRPFLGSRFALVFLMLYWLSPWRLYHSGFLWEPTYLFLPAALHLWCCVKLRDTRGRVASAILAGTLVLTMQLHGSFLLLVILTVLLYFRRLIRISWWAGAVGAILGATPMVPLLRALAAGDVPQLVARDGFYGYGLVAVYPVLKGLLYWLRMGPLDIGRLGRVVFLDSDWWGADTGRVIVYGATMLLCVLAISSVAISAWAAWWYFRRFKPAPEGTSQSSRERWLRSYSLTAVIAVLVSCALSPVVVQSWHLLIAFPTAIVPVAAWISTSWPPRRGWLRWAVILFLLLRLPEAIVIGLGHRAYRQEENVAVTSAWVVALPPGPDTMAPLRPATEHPVIGPFARAGRVVGATTRDDRRRAAPHSGSAPADPHGWSTSAQRSPSSSQSMDIRATSATGSSSK